MIARIWRGWITRDKADAYQQFLSTQVLPEIASRNLDGYNGAYLLRREIEDDVEFSTIMLFDSIDHIRAFTGEDYAVAYVPDEARAVLSRFDERSTHYEILSSPDESTR